jgi:restriction system protein
MVPEFSYFMLPLLEFLSDNKVHSSAECVDGVCKILNLTPEDMAEPVRKGSRTKVVDRTQWSKTYLEWAGLVRTERRGHYVITAKGLELIANKPKHIDSKFLSENYPIFVTNSSSKKADSPNKYNKADIEQHNPPAGHSDSDTIMAIIKSSEPYIIAKVLCRILNALGYYCEIEDLTISKSSIQGKFYRDTLKLFPAFLYVNIAASKVTRNDVGQVLPLMYESTCNSAIYLAINELAEDARRFSAPSANIITMDVKQLSGIVIEKGIGFNTVESKVLNTSYFTE